MPAKEQIHDSNLLKLQSNDQLSLEARFKEAEKLVHKWNRDRIRINEEVRKKLVSKLLHLYILSLYILLFIY